MKSPSAIVNAMSVDVEDYFQVSAFESHFNREGWDQVICRVEENVEKVLTLFEARNIKATFFTLGWVAERYPSMIKKIVGHGHELASHGRNHVRVHNQSPGEFREDVAYTRKLLEDISGSQIKGYRAASYSISKANLWAHDILAEAGYQYSSSIAPIKHDLYGIPDAPRFPFKTANEQLMEIPISTIRLAGKNINCGGGGWFRFFPYTFSRWAISQINTAERNPCIFYFHPWEIDPEQPRVKGASLKTSFRHYVNLARMKSRLERLLDDFQWDRADNVFLSDEYQKGRELKSVKWADYDVASP